MYGGIILCYYIGVLGYYGFILELPDISVLGY